MNRFGPSQAALAANFDRRANSLLDGQLPSIDDTLEAMTFGESLEQIEALENTGSELLINNPYIYENE